VSTCRSPAEGLSASHVEPYLERVDALAKLPRDNPRLQENAMPDTSAADPTRSPGTSVTLWHSACAEMRQAAAMDAAAS
jgi:hypothetical protein